ncbi:MAG TPA: hypothetical protein VJH37_05070 [Candidatus Nanoarchaeia archaeon]|nr:hypothetical protein [Candidatus Nanoarchaeia archaeon]
MATLIEGKMKQRDLVLLVSREWGSSEDSGFMRRLAEIRDITTITAVRDPEKQHPSIADTVDLYIPRRDLEAAKRILAGPRHEPAYQK